MANNLADHIVEVGAYINNWDNRDKWVQLPDGTVTPSYLSCRRLISIPETKIAIKKELSDLARIQFAKIATAVMALATAGIVWGDAISDELAVPFGYVRGEKKAHGVGKLVEGNPPQRSNALLVDDTLFTGISFLVAKEALQVEREIGTIGAITIASLYAGGTRAYSELLDAPTHSLVTHEEICTSAKNSGLLSDGQFTEMMNYYDDPIGYQFKEF